MKKIVLLVLVLVTIDFMLVLNEPYAKSRAIKKSEGEDVVLFETKDSNWEYVKEHLYSGKGETDFVYKLDYQNRRNPILIVPDSATQKDSLALNEIIKELRILIPNRTIDYFKNFSGKSFKSLPRPNKEKTLIKGIEIGDLRFSLIKLDFGNKNVGVRYGEFIETLLPDGSIIGRTNPPREDRYIAYPNEVWFQFKDTISNETRKNYIQYEVLRTLCYIYPKISYSTNAMNNEKGVFSTSNYIPHLAEFNDKDSFLIQKLYADDFQNQFKTYLSTSYSWLYAINFLNKSLATMIAWGVIICIALFAIVLLLSFFQNRKFEYSYLNYLFPLLFVILYYIHLVWVYVYITDVGASVAFNTHILFGLLSACVLSVIGAFLFWVVEKFWINKIEKWGSKLVIKVVFTFFVFNFPILILLMVKGFDTGGFFIFYLPTFIVIIVLSFGRGLLIYLNHFSENLIKQKDLELSSLKALKSQAEVKLLQSQINPHFLYNSLNSIASLAQKDAVKTEKMALSLSDLFKYTINRKGKKSSTVGDEVEMVKNYLEVEQIRFGDRLNFSVEVDESLDSLKIPMFLIQPLVENAIKHGISKIENDGWVHLKIHKNNHNLIIKVMDNGPDFPDGLVSGHGLQTVHDLLKLSYGDKATINTQNHPEKGITITIKNMT